MLIDKARQVIRADLESPTELRRFGTGWLSGVAALVASVAGLFFVLCLRFPSWLTVPQIRGIYNTPPFRLGLHLLLIVSFALAIVSLVLRTNRALGFLAIVLALLATALGGSRVHSSTGELTSGPFLGLDWFVLNVIFTGFLFIPLERLFGKHRAQPLFRVEWREDLFYYLVSSLFVQALTFLSMTPALTLTSHTHWVGFRAAIASQPILLQVFEIMFLTDLVQYWLHRAFHRVPFLWGFHAVHHSAQSMDWMAGARMHVMEIIILRGTTVIPMYVLGFGDAALHVYILLVYVHSTFLHANIGWNFDRIGPFLATPRFHHWHHGVEAEAIDVNFAIHFPVFDRLFGTFHLPRGQWPRGYGIEGHPVPKSYWRQFLYPFTRSTQTSPPAKTTIIALAMFWLAGVACLAADNPPMLEIGSAAPDFNLPGVDGKNHSLKEYADAKILCIIFTCNHCPTAQAYEERIIKLHADYKDKGVALVAIMPNDPLAVRLDELGYSDLGDSLDDMKIRAKQRGFKFPYLFDGETQSTAKSYGVIATPHVYIFDQSRRLRYVGRIDNSEVKEVTSRDTANALDDLLADKPARVNKTKVFGCSTKWASKREDARKWLAQADAEPVELNSIDASGVKALAKNDGKKLRLVNVWATWCPPCVNELPDLVTINRMYKKRGFEIVTISMDAPDKKTRALEKLTELHAAAANYFFSDDDKDKLADSLDKEWQGPVPHTLLIAPGGKVIYRHTGEIDVLELRAAIVGVYAVKTIPRRAIGGAPDELTASLARSRCRM